MAEVTLTISAEDDASAILNKVEQGVTRLGDTAKTSGAKVGEGAKAGAEGLSGMRIGLDNTMRSLNQLLTPANLFGTFIGVTLVGALRRASAEVLNYVSEIKELSLVTRSSMDDLVALKLAAGDLGVGTGKLQRAFFLLANEIDTAGSGLARFGIKTRDNQGFMKNEVQILLELSQAYIKATNKSAALNQLRDVMGRQAVTLIPLLERLGEKMKEGGEDAKKLGLEITKNTIQSFKEMDIAIGDVGDAMLGIKLQIMQDLEPLMTGLAKAAKFVAESFAGMAADESTRFLRQIAVISATVIAALAALAFAISVLKSAFAALGLSAILKTLMEFAPAMAGPQAAFVAAAAVILLAWKPIVSLFSSLFDGLTGGMVSRAESSLSGFFRRMGEQAKQFWRYLSGPSIQQQIGPSSVLKTEEKIPEPISAPELQKQASALNQLIQLQNELAVATMAPAAAQIKAAEVSEQQQLIQLATQYKSTQLRVSDNEYAAKRSEEIAKSTVDKTVEFRELEVLAIKGAAEKIVQIKIKQAQEEISADKQVALARLSTMSFGEDLVKRQTEIEIKAAKDIYAISRKTEDDKQQLTRTTAIAEATQTKQLQQMDQERLQSRLAINATIQEQEVTQQGIALDLRRSQVEEELRLSDHLASQQLISIEEHTKAQTDAAGKMLAIRLAELGQEAKAAQQQFDRDMELNDRSLVDSKSRALKELQIREDLNLKLIGIERQQVAVVSDTQAKISGSIREGSIKALEEEKKLWVFISSEVQNIGDKLSATIAMTTSQVERLTDAQVKLKKITPIEALIQRRDALKQEIEHTKKLSEAVGIAADEQHEFAVKAAEAEAQLKELNKELSVTGQIEKIFAGLTDIFSMFGIKLGKFILMLQGLPRALSGLKEVAAGIGGVLSLVTGVNSPASAGTADAVGDLGAASSEAANNLGIFGGIVEFVTRLLSVFGEGLNTFGGKIGEMLTSMGVPTEMAGMLGGGASGGMAGFGISQLFGGGTSTQIGGVLGGIAGSFMGSPIIGSIIGSAVGKINELLWGGNKAAEIGATIGTFLMPGIGTVLGGFIGGLFGSVPKGKLKAVIEPFDRSSLDNTIDEAVKGIQVGSARVNVGGNVIGNKKQHKVQQQIAEMLNGLLRGIVDTTVALIDVLPTRLGVELDAALSALEETGLEIVGKKWKGKDAGKKLKKRIKGLADEAVQELFDALYGADLDLKKLGGGERGDAAKGFDAVTNAISTMSAVIKEMDVPLEIITMSLAEFTMKSVDYFKRFSKDGESFAETVQRVTEEFNQLFGIIDTLDTEILALTTDIDSAVSRQVKMIAEAQIRVVDLVDALTIAIESGASPGEVAAAAEQAAAAVNASLQMQIELVSTLKSRVDALQQALLAGLDTLTNITTTIVGLQREGVSGSGVSGAPIEEAFTELRNVFNATDNLGTRISVWSSALTILLQDMDAFTAHLGTMQNGFQTLLTSLAAAPPEQALALADQLVKGIQAGLAAGITTIQADFARQRATIQNASAAQIKAIEAERDAIQDAMDTRIDALDAERDAIESITDARLDALKAERDAIEDANQEVLFGLQEQLRAAQAWISVVQSVRAQLQDIFLMLAPTQPQTSLDQVMSDLRSAFGQFQAGPTPELGTKVQDLARLAIQVAQTVPGMDLPSLAFRALTDEITGMLTAIESVGVSQESVESLTGQIRDIEEAQRLSLEAIDAEMQAANEMRASQLAGIDAQIEAARDAQVIQLAAIDLRLEAIRENEAAQLDALSAAEQAAVQELQARALNALEGVRQIVLVQLTALQEQQRIEQERLQAILGDQTYEQYIASKQKEAVTLLQGIQETLRVYLGSLIQVMLPVINPPAPEINDIPTAPTGGGTGFFTPIQDNFPAMAAGGIVTRPTIALIGESGAEAVIPLNKLPAPGRSTPINLSINIQVVAGPGANGRQLAKELDPEIAQIIAGPSSTHSALLKLVKEVA